MFIVTLTGSRFFKAPRYLVAQPGAHIVQRSKARATRMSRDAAEKIASKWSDPNGFTASVEAI